MPVLLQFKRLTAMLHALFQAECLTALFQAEGLTAMEAWVIACIVFVFAGTVYCTVSR
jgi:hypothetical protein